MRILICGDVVGKSGRRALEKHLPGLKARLKTDFVVVNGENAAHGFGITETICKSFYDWGVDVITTGNHVWDNRPVMNYIDSDEKLLRPLNYPPGTPGMGVGIYENPAGQRLMVMNAMARLFMDPLDDPFQAVETVLDKTVLGRQVDAIVVDFHGEASSEKQSMGVILDGRVSAVVGTHTHVPTSDGRIMPGGTAFQTDLGMTGDYDSVIGMKKQVASERFLTKVSKERLQPAEGDATLSAVLVVTDDKTGLAESIAPVRVGGALRQNIPEI